MNLNQFIFTAIISCLVFLAITTLSKKTNTPIGYRFLAILFILIASIFADDLLAGNKLYNESLYFLLFFQPLIFAFPPTIYLATIYLTSVKKIILSKIIPHCIPYLAFLVFYSVLLSGEKIDFLQPENVVLVNKYFNFFLTFVIFAQVFFYLYLSFKQLKNHQKTLPIFVSNISGNDFDWLKKTIIGLLVIVIVWFLETVVRIIINDIEGHSIVYFIYLMGFYYVGVQVTRQKDVFPTSKEQRENIADLVEEQLLEEELMEEKLSTNEIVEIDKTNIIPALSEILPERKKVLTDESIEIHKTALLSLMENEKPYLDGEITLSALGQMLHLNTYYKLPRSLVYFKK